MIGSRPSMFWRVCWKFISPIFLFIILIFSLIDFIALDGMEQFKNSLYAKPCPRFEFFFKILFIRPSYCLAGWDSLGGAWPYHLSGSYQPMLYISTFNKREHPWRNLQKYPLPRPYFQSHCQKMPTESASEHLKTSHLKPQSMPQLSKSSNSSWLNQTFSPGMVETWYISFWSSFKKPLVATVARNCLFYSIPKARIMVDKFRIHLNTFRLKLSEHTNFCIDNQHCRHNCQTKTKYSDKKHPQWFAVDTTAPLPNFCAHS